MSEKDELLRKVMQVCASCPHAKWQGGTMTCDRKKSQCHSKRVRKWLEELKSLERDEQGNGF